MQLEMARQQRQMAIEQQARLCIRVRLEVGITSVATRPYQETQLKLWGEVVSHTTSAQFEKWNLSPPNEPFKWLGYRAHTYGAVPAAYDTIKMEDDTGTYKYISYYNFSGTDGNYYLPSSPVMPKLVQFMDNAIMKRQTGYSISGVSLGSIPTKAVCNRNEWVADTTGQVKLDCPAL